MNEKKIQMVITGIRCLETLVNQHINGWEKEFEQNDGYLKANLKINLYAMRKAINYLHEKFKIVPVQITYRDKFINEAMDQHLVGKQKKNTIVTEKQRYLPYDSFITDFYILGVILDVLKSKYELTIKRLNIETQMDKIIKNYNIYAKFFEREIVIM